MEGNEILAVGDKAQAEYDAANPPAEETEATDAPEGGDVTGDKPTEGEGDEVTDAPEETEGESAPEEPEEEGTKYYWGDLAVEVEIPDEISKVLDENKIDKDKLLGELFAKDGKFEVSPETRKALDKAFGEHIVTGYLNLYRQQNAMAVDKFKQDAETTRKTVEANSQDFDTLVGGDEGWNELAQWASDNLEDAEIEHINNVMSLPVEHYGVQRTVIEALKIKREAGLREKNGDEAVTLLTDSGSPVQKSSEGVPNTLTREQAQELWGTERYRTDPKYAAAVDEARRRGQKSERVVRR